MIDSDGCCEGDQRDVGWVGVWCFPWGGHTVWAVLHWSLWDIFSSLQRRTLDSAEPICIVL